MWFEEETSFPPPGPSYPQVSGFRKEVNLLSSTRTLSRHTRCGVSSSVASLACVCTGFSFFSDVTRLPLGTRDTPESLRLGADQHPPLFSTRRDKKSQQEKEGSWRFPKPHVTRASTPGCVGELWGSQRGGLAEVLCVVCKHVPWL